MTPNPSPELTLALSHLATPARAIGVTVCAQGQLETLTLFWTCGHELTIAATAGGPLAVTLRKSQPLAEPKAQPEA